jgi:hypothetical protein
LSSLLFLIWVVVEEVGHLLAEPVENVWTDLAHWAQLDHTATADGRRFSGGGFSDFL